MSKSEINKRIAVNVIGSSKYGVKMIETGKIF